MPTPALNFEEYAQTLQQVMADAIARAEQLQRDAEAEREAAHALDEKRRDILRDLENKAQRMAEDEAPQVSARLKKEIIASVAAKLHNSDRSDQQIEALLKALEA